MNAFRFSSRCNFPEASVKRRGNRYSILREIIKASPCLSDAMLEKLASCNLDPCQRKRTTR